MNDVKPKKIAIFCQNYLKGRVVEIKASIRYGGEIRML